MCVLESTICCDIFLFCGTRKENNIRVLQKHTNDVRIGIVHNPTSLPARDDAAAHFLSRAVHVALETQEPGMAKSFVTKLLKEENVAALRSGAKSLRDLAVHVSRDCTYLYMKDTSFDLVSQSSHYSSFSGCY